MGGTIIVSLADSSSTESSSSSKLKEVASNPLLGDILALLSAALYAVYITLIRKKLPDEDDPKSGRVSMAQFLGFLGLFNLLIFLPVALLLNFTKLEAFNNLTWTEAGLIVGKGTSSFLFFPDFLFLINIRIIVIISGMITKLYTEL